jgi:hypothetical protein
MGIFYSFYVFFHEFFADLVTFWQISAKLMGCCHSYCAVYVPVYVNAVVQGLPSASDAVMFLLSQLL